MTIIIYMLNRVIRFCGIVSLAVSILVGCSTSSDQADLPLFTRLSAEQTGVDFQNRIVEHEGFNVLEYEYFYNGGGVAIGDINADGLPDLYFTANMEPDQLYLNRGNLRFENITAQAGLVQEPGWKTGVSMADVNGDGRLDIYVARSGQVGAARRRNLLYINNGDLTFTEQAAAYGLDSPSYSNHASFFDYDRDGDLDMYLLNHPIRRYAHFVVDLMKVQRDSLAGDKLFRNDDGFFVDVSEEAGIIGNPLGFGLSATVSDVNQDGWPDLYVANDYIEEDYLYINQRDGTFSEEVRNWITTASYSSMGADIADIDNDGRVDIFTLDMLADNHLRQKILKGPEDYTFYEQMRAGGFHDQAMRNMLHVRYGDAFSEVGRLAGISTTDWSWSALMADFDNDGLKDLMVTNGYMRDYTDLDFLEDILGKAREASAMGQQFSSLEMVREMPSTPLPNYIFRNAGDLRFEDLSDVWQFDEPTFSNGAGYADLDGDGDLDLVINNINQEAFIYRNEASQSLPNRYLRLKLDGPAGNSFGAGAKVYVSGGGVYGFQEATMARGYLSSVEPVLHFGVGAAERVDVRVVWPDGREQVLKGISTNQTLVARHAESVQLEEENDPEEPLPPVFVEEDASRILPFSHREDDFVDFEREPLLPHMLSRLGPAVAAMDVNRDGLDDVFLGGARGQAGALFLQQLDGSFQEASMPDFAAHKDYEDVGAAFFDADTDGDPDLYVASGGNAAPAGDPLYQDRLYLNNGFGRFEHDAGRLPEIRASTEAIAAHDYDDDGDLDLFVGGRVPPGAYPIAPRSYLLENQDAVFTDVTAEKAPVLLRPGMLTDAGWGDLDGDGRAELVTAGEWMPLSVWQWNGDQLGAASFETGLEAMPGFWYTVKLADLDGDGDLDLIGGNQGLNGSLHASPEKPASIYAADIDANGTMDPVITHVLRDQRHTVYWLNELVEQIPRWATLFPSQANYAAATFDEIANAIPPDALKLDVSHLETRVFENDGKGRFTALSLPVETQFAPVRSIIVDDITGEGLVDLLLAGNDHTTRAQWGRDAAGRGVLLSGNGQLEFTHVHPGRFGIDLSGDLRHLVLLKRPTTRLIAVYNDGPARIFKQ